MEFFRNFFGGSTAVSHPNHYEDFNNSNNTTRVRRLDPSDQEYSHYFTQFGFPFWQHPHQQQNYQAFQVHEHDILPEINGEMEHIDAMFDIVERMAKQFALLPEIGHFESEFSVHLPPEFREPQQFFSSSSQSSSPRDQLLKQPNSTHSIIPEIPAEREGCGNDGCEDSPCNTHKIDGVTPQDDFDNQFHHPVQPGLHDFDERGVHNFMNPFIWLHSFMGNFDNFDLKTHHGFEGGISPDALPPSAGHSPRDTLLKKEDQDLDNTTKSTDINAIFKDGPGYSYHPNSFSAGPSGPTQPHSDKHYVQQPLVTHSFTSTSISRTVRPDGRVEERHTYRDSKGNEEVTVTEINPGQAGSLVPSDDPFLGGGGLGSFFGGFFR